MWVAQSYGRYNPSFLYASSVPIPTESTIDFSSVAFYPFILPPGLEDLHLTEDQQQIWSLTEFGPQEGADNDRLVLAFNTADILPPVINSNEELEEKFDHVLNLYPNPSNGTLMIDIPNKLSGKLSIYDLSGQLVFEKNITINDRALKIKLAPGLYLAQLVSKGKKVTSKLMVH